MTATNEAPQLRPDSTRRAVPQATALMAIHASMTAWEAAAAQEGRLELVAAAMAAGLDIQTFGWPAVKRS